ncbi:MAG: DNA polymerase III subunit gamma/tau, partial [Firmicutes bacterium]|nr:DNA polymerase III subunit gamma/tau [Bacillota bacterium]
MSYTALYRRFRPGTFASLIGQEHVGKTLAAACRRGSLAHAYLFCGPRGTGKTSAARILARAVCCLNPAADGEPCGTCAACQRITNGESLDVHEIDAASNRGIDDIRELRDRVRYAAAVEKYKVYIIDEVHMLSAEAFNALLKTLEEPPPGVLFVLATTEPHKVPVTIMSRCQRFDFRRIGEDDIRAHLLDIAAAEGLAIDVAAAELIARRADGGMRDAISLLDQCAGCAAGAPIDARTVSQVLGVVDADFLAAAADNLLSGDMASLLARVDELNRAGADNRQFLYSLLEYIRQLLLQRLSNQPEGLSAAARELPLPRLLAILQCFGDADGRLRYSAQPRITLELALIKACSLAAGDDGRIPQKGAVKPAPAVNAAATAQPAAPPQRPAAPAAPAAPAPGAYVPKPAPKPQPKP